jgi:hypothetical protein
MRGSHALEDGAVCTADIHRVTAPPELYGARHDGDFEAIWARAEFR